MRGAAKFLAKKNIRIDKELLPPPPTSFFRAKSKAKIYKCTSLLSQGGSEGLASQDKKNKSPNISLILTLN